MIDRIIATALQEALFRLPPSALGLRSEAIPTDEHIEDCVNAAKRILATKQFSGCHFVIGSSKAGTQSDSPQIVVLPPDAAAAEATRLRNSRVAAGAFGFHLIYLNTQSTPGEAGLDVLCELSARTIVRHFAESSDLPLLAEVAKSKSRQVVHRLEDSTVDLLAQYAQMAEEHGSESYALPLLSLIPRDHATSQPSVSWATDFDSLTGEKLVSKLRETLNSLEEFRGADLERATAQFSKLVPAKFSSDPLPFVTTMCKATLRFASGYVEYAPQICGLTSTLLRLFRRGIGAGAVPPLDPMSGAPLADDVQTPTTRRPLLEEDVLREQGPAALLQTPSRLDDDGRLLTVAPDAGGEALQLRSREGAALVKALIESLPPDVWIEGAAVNLDSAEPLLSPLSPTGVQFEITSRIGDWRRECIGSLREKIETYMAARSALIRKISDPTLVEMDAFLDEDGDGTPTAEGRVAIQGVFVMEAFPLTAVSIARGEVDAYLAAYEGLVLDAFGGPTAAPESVCVWLMNLDIAFHTENGFVTAARLLPTHPLRLAHAKLWLDHGRRPPTFPAALAVHFRSADSLTPHGREYSFHRPRSVGPGPEGLATAAREGLRSLWNLVAPRGLARAIDIELVDTSNPVETIEALCAEMLDCFDEDASIGTGIHLRIACAFSDKSRESEAVVPSPEELLPLSAELLGARPGAGVTLQLLSTARKAGVTPCHLAIQAMETPYVRLPIDLDLPNIPGTEVVYVPGRSGNISLIKVAGNSALDAYQRLLEEAHSQTGLGYGPVERSPAVGNAIVRTLVCRQGWPLKLPFDDTFLSYTEDAQHIVVSLCDGEILTKLTSEKLTALSARIEGDAIMGPNELRDGIRAMYSCRGFFPRLLADVDARHLLGDLGLLRAFSHARVVTDGREPLLISLDSPDGRAWARTMAALVDGPETRADLLIIEADQAMGQVVSIRVAELKARTSDSELKGDQALKSLARQAQITTARVRSCFTDGDDKRRRTRVEALRRLAWMGAGHQLRALQWKNVLASLDRALTARQRIDVTAECWIVPEDEWGGELAFKRSFPALSEIGDTLAESETVRFRVLSRQTVKGPLPGTAGGHRTPQPLRGSPAAKSKSSPPPPAPPSPASPGQSVTLATLPKDLDGQAVIHSPAPLGPPASVEPASGTQVVEIPLGVNPTTGVIEKWRPYAIAPRLSNQHVLIVGKSGSGKSETTKALIWELDRRGLPTIIFDYQGEYGDKTKDFYKAVKPQVFDVMQGLPINPFEVPIDPRTGERRPFIEAVFRLADTLSRVFKGSGDIQLGTLRDAIKLCYAERGFLQTDPNTWANDPPTMEMLQRHLEALARERGAQAKNLQVRLQPLFESGIFTAGRAGFRFDELFKQTTVLLMTSGITDLMLAASRLMLEGIYAAMLTLGESATIRVMACVDEAHKLCGDETITTLIKEARKYGLGLVLSSQETRDFHPSVFANVGTLVCLQLEEADAAVMAKQIAGQDPPRQKQLKNLIMAQAFPEGVVRSNHFQPYLPLRLIPFHERAKPELAPPIAQPSTLETVPVTAAKKGDTFLGYELIKPLKGGGMAEVYQALDPATQELVCVKRVRESSLDADALQREAQIYQKLQRIDCPNLLRVRDFGRDGDYIALVTDYADGGDLAEYVQGEQNGRLKPAKAKQIALQIANALAVLHGANIVHRDLKPENILLRGDQWQIADFGIAKNLTRLVTNRTFQSAGTLGYMAREQMDGSEAAPSADVYSFAKILVFMITGSTDKDYVTQAGWWTLTNKCLQPEPDRRPTIEQVIAELKQIPG